MFNLRNTASLLAFGVFGAALAACGSETSTAELRLMDAPPAGVTAVNVTIAAMQVHVAKAGSDDRNGGPDAGVGDGGVDGGLSDDDNDNRWYTLAVNRTIDLVQHQGETAADVLGQLPLPAGKITQLRLLINTSGPNTATRNGVVCNLDTSKVERKGVKIDHVFKAFDTRAGNRHEITVDFKLDESLKLEGDCFRLEPKLKLHKVKTDGKDELL